jgi:hypothetical protein
LQEKAREQLEGDERVLSNLFGQMRYEYAHISSDLGAVFSLTNPDKMLAYIENSSDIFAA